MNSLKPYEMINEIRRTRMVPGICTICPWYCPTEVYVRDDKVIYVRGNETAPNRGTLCVKGIASIHLTRDPNRLLYPMKKNTAGNFDRIGWDEAFSLIAEKLQNIKDRDGPEAVCFFWHQDSNVKFPFQLFTQLYGTPNCSGYGAACDQERRLAALSVYGHPLLSRDFAQSRFIMLWGTDLFGSSGSPYENSEIMEALKHKAKLVVVDPVRSRTAEKANIWVPIKPGTDGALALAMVHRIIEDRSYDQTFCERWVYGFDQFFEHVQSRGYSPKWAEPITGIPQDTIIELADEFALTKPAIMDGFTGLTNYSNGLAVFRTIFILNAITGNVDGPGNIIIKSRAPIGMPIAIPVEKFATSKRPFLSKAMGYPLAPDILSQLLPRAVIENDPYPIKAAFFHMINPAMSLPNPKLFRRMMSELELSVTIDIYMSETTQLSDLILPEASFYERAEIREGSWTGPQVLFSQPAIAPRGESKPIYEIMKGLAQKLGYGGYFEWDSWEDWARRMTEHIPISYEELKQRGTWEGKLEYHKFLGKGFQTLTGKTEAWSKSFQQEGFDPLPVYTDEHRVKPDQEFGMQAINSKMQYHCGTHTQENPYLMQIENENWVELNPQDASRYGITEGDRIEVESPLEKVNISARISENVQPGVLRVIHGHGFGRSAGTIGRGKGAHFNPLIGTRVNPISGGIGYNECKVKIRKI